VGVVPTRLLCVGVVAFGAASLAGCGPNGFVSLGGQGGPRGWIRGSVVRGPGVDPRSGGAGGEAVPVAGDPIVARQIGGPAAAVAVSARDGSFRMNVPAGVYRVTEGICGVTARANVQGEAALRVALKIPNSC
jgi:hypothetical protein